jgi:hypothetical protein
LLTANNVELGRYKVERWVNNLKLVIGETAGVNGERKLIKPLPAPWCNNSKSQYILMISYQQKTRKGEVNAAESNSTISEIPPEEILAVWKNELRHSETFQ